MEVEYSTSFIKRYKKLSKEVREAFKKQKDLFRTNPFHPTLKTHKLHGPLSGRFAFSVTSKYRTMFCFIGGKVIFLDIGNHDIYD